VTSLDISRHYKDFYAFDKRLVGRENFIISLPDRVDRTKCRARPEPKTRFQICTRRRILVRRVALSALQIARHDGLAFALHKGTESQRNGGSMSPTEKAVHSYRKIINLNNRNKDNEMNDSRDIQLMKEKNKSSQESFAKTLQNRMKNS
jgi:hypothetical protein